MSKIKPFLRASLHFLAYLLFAALIIKSYLWAWYVVAAVGAKLGNRFWLSQLHSLDIMICSFVHGTFRRTISGYTGQHAKSKRRYRIAEIVIDWLAIKFGDEPRHCCRAHINELKMGLIVNPSNNIGEKKWLN